MKTIIDYVKTTMAPLTVSNFTPVDSLVLAELAYTDFTGIVPAIDGTTEPVRIADLLKAENFPQMFGGLLDQPNNQQLLYVLAASPRYRDIKMLYYADERDEEKELQFSAVTYLLPDGTAYVAYRGTDTTIVGWKEDFNMAFISPVPAQQLAAQYLDTVSRLLTRPLRVGGHSKGGNLAVYAATYVSPQVQDRLLQVYSHDGPGFKDEIFNSEEFLRIENKIHKTVPKSSVVGMLLQNQEQYHVVDSNGFWILQHDPFTWGICDSDFCYLEDVRTHSKNMNTALNQWLATISDEKRALLVDTIFSIISATNAQTLGDLSADWHKEALSIINTTRNLDPQIKRFITKLVKELMHFSLKYIVDTPKPAIGHRRK